MQAHPVAPRAARLTVLSGPSGVGKGTVMAAVRRSFPDVWVSVSVTTRTPRPGERDGVEYRFVDRDRFEQLRGAGELLEWAEYAGHFYGTPVRPVHERLRLGAPALLVIDLQGARQVRASMPEARFVFLAPPDFAELEARLRGRGTDADEQVGRRLALAAAELAAADEFDAVVVNDDIDRAAAELVGLLGPV